MRRSQEGAPTRETRSSDHPEVALVLALRAQHKTSEQTQSLWEKLQSRCEALFLCHVQGLRHRPDLREEALANMRERLWREVMFTENTSITEHFPHYLRCMASEEFRRILRQEGLLPRRDASPRRGNVPLHVPRSLISSLDELPSDNTSQSAKAQASLLADEDLYGQWHAEMEVQRLLAYLPDPLDRTVLVLRAIEGMKWDDIAGHCHCTERTARLRYKQVCAFLRNVLSQEQEAERRGPLGVRSMHKDPPLLKRPSSRKQCLRKSAHANLAQTLPRPAGHRRSRKERTGEQEAGTG